MTGDDLAQQMEAAGLKAPDVARTTGLDARTVRRLMKLGTRELDPKYSSVERAVARGFDSYSSARLVADIQQMVAILARRLDEHEHTPETLRSGNDDDPEVYIRADPDTTSEEI